MSYLFTRKTKRDTADILIKSSCSHARRHNQKSLAGQGSAVRLTVVSRACSAVQLTPVSLLTAPFRVKSLYLNYKQAAIRHTAATA